METFKQLILKRLDKDELADLAMFGAASGFGGLTYCHEITRLYQKYHDEIWNMLGDDADNCGMSILEFDYGEILTDSKQLAVLLVWYAAEKIAYVATNPK